MEIIAVFLKEVMRGKVEIKFAAVLFLGILISTGTDNITEILTAFKGNEIIGIFFTEQLWLVYSVFFAVITFFLFGRARLYLENMKVEVKKIDKNDISKTGNLEVGVKILSMIRKIVDDLLVALICIFVSLVFSLSIVQKKLGIILSTNICISIVLQFILITLIFFYRVLIITKGSIVEGEVHADLE